MAWCFKVYASFLYCAWNDIYIHLHWTVLFRIFHLDVGKIEMKQNLAEVFQRILDETLDTGMEMSYIQVFNYLIHYYKKNSSLPATVWKKD